MDGVSLACGNYLGMSNGLNDMMILKRALAGVHVRRYGVGPGGLLTPPAAVAIGKDDAEGWMEGWMNGSMK
jgi:hypothetical protein